MNIKKPDLAARLLAQYNYKPGDPEPEGFIAQHAWEKVQVKAGLKQAECGKCGKEKKSQEMSDQIFRYTFHSRKGPVTLEYPMCKKCAA